jgi:2-succinyl-5-enolpyruvyl-6-hydroxy-3-cyclohexene-1-carboxylate synthase
MRSVNQDLHQIIKKRVEVAARQAVQSAIEFTGVSHINFSFDKPFEPEDDFLKLIEKENLNHSKRAQTDYSQDLDETTLGEKFWSQLISAEKTINNCRAQNLQN